MENAARLIDEIMEDHSNIIKDVEGVEQACNDATALTQLSQADRDFSPGRLDRTESIKKLRDTITKCEAGTSKHFSREETALLEIFKKHGDEEMMTQFYDLLKQHQEIKNRFAEAKSRADKLTSGEVAIGLWNASANDLLAYMNRTRQLIEEHASNEDLLFRALRNSMGDTEQDPA
ncbi:MAG: hemerythrin domain-containing protein [Dehalococcoidia bacterium]